MSFRNWKVSTKLFAITLLYSGCSAILIVFLVSAVANSQLIFARAEVAGNRFQAPVEDALRYVQEHQMLVHGSAQGLATRDDVARAQNQVDEAFSQLKTIDAELGAGLGFTAEALAARDRKNALDRKSVV